MSGGYYAKSVVDEMQKNDYNTTNHKNARVISRENHDEEAQMSEQL